MEQCEKVSMLNVIENCRVNRYSGMIKFEIGSEQLSLWFVRGNLAHAGSSNGGVGWKALEAAKSESVVSVFKSDGELPPERTIRVDTMRLLKAMKSSLPTHAPRAMHVPVPLHARLQQKFMELKHRVAGLKSFETIQAASRIIERPSGVESNLERTILEKDPRGAKWTHLAGEMQLVLRGDENISTSEIMWAGSELWKEIDKANRRATENE